MAEQRTSCPHYWNTHTDMCMLALGHDGRHVFEHELFLAHPDPRDQRIAALEAAVAKATEQLAQRTCPEHPAPEYTEDGYEVPGFCGPCRAHEIRQECNAAEAERDDLRTQLTARDVAGATLVEVVQKIVDCFDVEDFIDLAAMDDLIPATRNALATAPAAWRK